MRTPEVIKLLELLADIFGAEHVDYGICPICKGPLDISGYCIDIACPGYEEKDERISTV